MNLLKARSRFETHAQKQNGAASSSLRPKFKAERSADQVSWLLISCASFLCSELWGQLWRVIWEQTELHHFDIWRCKTCIKPSTTSPWFYPEIICFFAVPVHRLKMKYHTYIFTCPWFIQVFSVNRSMVKWSQNLNLENARLAHDGSGWMKQAVLLCFCGLEWVIADNKRVEECKYVVTPCWSEVTAVFTADSRCLFKVKSFICHLCTADRTWSFRGKM